MENFVFQNPTKLIFGKGQIATLAKQIPAGAKVMITCGGGSIFNNGIYEQVDAALGGMEVVLFKGIEPNPQYATLMKAVKLAKANDIDFLLAVGGGSVIDGTKFIASAMQYDGDPWEFMLDVKKIKSTTPMASILTLPATGSEMNCGAVISRSDINEKRAFQYAGNFPIFSILDPEAIFSLPKRQIANGIVDTFAHTLEQYLTVSDGRDMVMDRWAEGLLQTLIELAPELMADKLTYDAAANFMLTATMGLNGFIALGTTQDWATHMIGHELTALHGLDHGVTLAIIYPALMDVMRDKKEAKLKQYAERIWGTNSIDEAIEKTENFFRSLGIKTRLKEHNIGTDTITEIKRRFTERGWNVGERGEVTPERASTILTKAL